MIGGEVVSKTLCVSSRLSNILTFCISNTNLLSLSKISFTHSSSLINLLLELLLVNIYRIIFTVSRFLKIRLYVNNSYVRVLQVFIDGHNTEWKGVHTYPKWKQKSLKIRLNNVCNKQKIKSIYVQLNTQIHNEN